MSTLQAIILGIIQGLTEFLPVSSSGHLEIGKALLNVHLEENLGFTVIVHLATVLSTITVFFSDIKNLGTGVLKFKWNEETRYFSKLLLAAVPVIIIGLFFEDQIESLFAGNQSLTETGTSYNLTFVGIALLLTAVLLAATILIPSGQKKKIPFVDAIVMGIAQALAVIPGLSRSGSTIATGLILKNSREDVARFSFLMVLIPILGASGMKILEWIELGSTGAGIGQLVAGFIAAYVSGVLACKWMISLVKKGKLIYFAIYCAAVGILSIILSM